MDTKMHNIAGIVGSFDPFHYGHLDIVKRTLRFCDKVVIGILNNSKKSYMFNLDKRKEFIEATLLEANIPSENYQIVIYDGLVADFVTDYNIDVIVKGLRDEIDYKYEVGQDIVNQRMGVTTVFMPCSNEFIGISSTFIRDLANYPKAKDKLKLFCNEKVVKEFHN